MPTFKSVQGIWFACDKETENELKKSGIDHLGIHISEDPYLKQMEYVTGIPKHELMQGNHKSAMEQMMAQMQQNQQILTMFLMGDKEGATDMLKGIQQKSIDDKKAQEERSAQDPIEMARKEFEASQGLDNSFKVIPEKPSELKNLPDKKEDNVTIHEESPLIGSLAGMAKKGEVVQHRKLSKGDK